MAPRQMLPLQGHPVERVLLVLRETQLTHQVLGALWGRVMIIQAKFDSRCLKCSGAVGTGTKVEWLPGYPGVAHLKCDAAVSPSVAAHAPRRGASRRACGYPGCTGRNFCDECSE